MKKILFIGGDKRSIIAENMFAEKGYTVGSLGLVKDDFADIGNFDIIVLGVPSTRDNKTVFCPLTDRKILLSEIEEKTKNKLVISAGFSTENAKNTDILTLDSYALLNAVPTAEGAIAFAVSNTDFTLWKSNVLIIGNGRVGKILASRLKNFGCNLTVSARKSKDFSLLDTQNIAYMKTEDVPKSINNFDVVFNTVDHRIFDEPLSFGKTLLIDLSSKGCIDFDNENIKNLKVYKLPSLPFKTAPQTAGKIFFDTIMQIIECRE